MGEPDTPEEKTDDAPRAARINRSHMRLPGGRNVSPWSRRFVIASIVAVVILAPLWIDPLTLDSIRGARPSAGTTPPPGSAASGRPVATEDVARPWVALARDEFERSVPAGWGTADLGGEWQTSAASSLSVASGAGLVSIADSALGSATLGDASAHETSVTFTLEVDALPAQGDIAASAVLRRTPAGAAYVPSLHIAADGSVSVAVEATDGHTVRAVDVPAAIAELTVVPGSAISVRAEATGIDPATISIRAWRAGETEPAFWHASAIDWTGLLQRDGSVGLGWRPTDATAGSPIELRFTDFWAESADEGRGQ